MDRNEFFEKKLFPFNEFCEKNGISYTLAGNSALQILGSGFRHQALIDNALFIEIINPTFRIIEIIRSTMYYCCHVHNGTVYGFRVGDINVFALVQVRKEPYLAFDDFIPIIAEDTSDMNFGYRIINIQPYARAINFTEFISVFYYESLTE